MKFAIRTVLAVFALLLMLFASARAAGPSRYALIYLNDVATAISAYASVQSINDNGVAIGADFSMASGPQFFQNAIAWDASGAPRALALPGDAPHAMAAAINNNGLIVGTADSPTKYGSPYRAATFGQTQSAFLPAFSFSSGARATSVNAAGAIAGTDSGSPILYANSTFTPLSTGSSFYPRGDAIISDANAVYMSASTTNSGGGRAYRLVNATTHIALDPDSTHTNSVRDVNRSEKVVGSVTPAPFGSAMSAAIFANGSVTLLPSLGGPYSEARGINDRDVIVGTSSSARNVSPHAFAFIDGATLDLNSLIPANSGWTLTEAQGINNRGQIICNGQYDDDNNPATAPLRAAFRLDPIRTPGDTNYDDAVDFTDLLTLARNYGKSGDGNVFYETGDFNYDWSVDFADLLTLARNYGHPAAFAADWSLAQALAPEPSAFAAAAMLPMLLGRRRRRPAAAPDRSAIAC